MNCGPHFDERAHDFSGMEMSFDLLKNICASKWFNNIRLNLSNNFIVSLPSVFSSSIVNLNLSKNSIGMLPDAMQSMTKLTSLDVSENEITLLPPWLGKITSLETLKAHGNPLSGDQKQFAEKWIFASDALLGYLKHRQSDLQRD